MRWLIALILYGCALGLSCSARAEGGVRDITPLYTAAAIVTGTDMRQRPWGMAQCLREVLVKVAGDPRLRDDPQVLNLAGHADRYVVAFDYVDLMAAYKKNDDQGSYDRPHRLTVHFDPAQIDALLKGLGDRPWRGKRPVVVPVLLVRGPKPPPYTLSAETPRGAEQRGAFATAAGEFGIEARIPAEAEFAAWSADAEHFPFPAAPPPDATAANEAVVAGTLEWNETLPGWIGRWRLHWHGTDHAWSINGVNYDAAFRSIVSGVELVASGNGRPD